MPPNAFNLKQRLAALSLAPSSPSSPFRTEDGLPRTPASPTKLKKFSGPHWPKKSPSTLVHGEEQQAARNRVEEVMGKMIFQAGVDFE
jgi:Rho GTPase-activating protein 1